MSKKKTKRNKIISDYRKRLQILEARERREKIFADSGVEQMAVEKKLSPVSIQKTKRKIQEKTELSVFEKQELHRNALFIKKDLRKTVILSIVGMGILFGLYVIAPF
jgi:hypothetical protein